MVDVSKIKFDAKKSLYGYRMLYLWQLLLPLIIILFFGAFLIPAILSRILGGPNVTNDGKLGLIIAPISSWILTRLIWPLFRAKRILIGKELLTSKYSDLDKIKLVKEPLHILKLICVSLIFTLMVIIGLGLIIVPGIFLLVIFSMANHMMVENKDISIIAAFKYSYRLTKYYKKDVLIFFLSFIPHFILGFLTLGIYFLFFYPYFEVAYTNLFIDLKNSGIIYNKV